MVQREVADRFFAVPGTKAYGAVSVQLQLVTERTGLPSRVARGVPPAAERRVGARRVPPRSAGPRPGREAARRGGVRAPPQDARELARAGGRRVPRAGRGRARGDRPRPGATRRAAPPRRVRRTSPPRSHDERAGAREDQPRPRGRADARGRPARGRDDPPARRARGHGLARAGAGALGRTGSRTTRSSGARSWSSRPQRQSSRAGARRSRSGSRSRPASAAEAPTPRPRSRSPARLLDDPPPRERLLDLAHGLGVDVPFFLESGPQLGLGDGAALEPVDLPQDYTVLLLLPHGEHKPSTAEIYGRFHGEDGFDERRRQVVSVAHAGRAADLASLPPNDLASSPLLGPPARARRVPGRRQRRRARRLRALPRSRRRRGRRGGGRRASARPGSRPLRGSVVSCDVHRG